MMTSEFKNQNVVKTFETVWLTHALYAAVQLDLADHITTQAMKNELIAKKVQADPDYLYRLLRALAANGFFSETAEREFCHNDASLQLCRNSNTRLRSMLELFGMGAMQRAWNHLGEGVASGIGPFEKANGAPLFPFLAEHPKDALSFNEAMVAYTASHAADVIAAYSPFKNATRILDIAGGLGHMLGHILQEYRHLQGAVFDLPELEKPAQNFLSEAGLQSRTGFIAGNFLESIPDGFDLYMIKNALWNWSDNACLQILQNVRKAIGHGKGRLLIIENLIRDENKASSTLMDLQMMVAPKGRCRTEAEYAKLLSPCGMRVSQVYDVQSTQIVECVPE